MIAKYSNRDSKGYVCVGLASHTEGHVASQAVAQAVLDAQLQQLSFCQLQAVFSLTDCFWVLVLLAEWESALH